MTIEINHMNNNLSIIYPAEILYDSLNLLFNYKLLNYYSSVKCPKFSLNRKNFAIVLALVQNTYKIIY
jgi:hypothetical protein